MSRGRRAQTAAAVESGVSPATERTVTGRADVAPLASRLLDVEAATAYYGNISEWTLRSFVENGHLRPVRLPACRRPGESSRRLLFDVRDLDDLIERSKR